ncbi:hypothetical protein SDC9_99211 [bioreactor metagenome]|uniref:Uncharacterized protein n=1 Tax=bioreactor metagenome TaxID=1076179 RepID=A0A645AGW4_9ZZZZ
MGSLGQPDDGGFNPALIGIGVGRLGDVVGQEKQRRRFKIKGGAKHQLIGFIRVEAVANVIKFTVGGEGG